MQQNHRQRSLITQISIRAQMKYFKDFERDMNSVFGNMFNQDPRIAFVYAAVAKN